jgi:HD-like signal output (HDOD) protein
MSQLNKPDLEKVLASTKLPALPASAVKILELSQDPSKGPRDFAKPIEADGGLMTQVLKFVNSSYFGFTREIAGVEQAISLVGIRPIKNFALWSAVFSIIPSPKIGNFDLKSLWMDSLRRAVFSRVLGKAIHLSNAEELFTAALLQDMAIPILLEAFPEMYAEIVKRRADDQLRLSIIEREVLGWDHAEAAAALCRMWHLPIDFARLIERHTNYEELLELGTEAADCAVVAIAALLPSCSDNEWTEQNEFFRAVSRVTSTHHIDFVDLFISVDTNFEEFAPLMHLTLPEKSLGVLFREAAEALRA